MNHSMVFSENDLHILNKIAISPDPITAYELSTTLEKDYSTIHKACKKLVVLRILKSDNETNDKNVPKKILTFTLYGFCRFVAQSELFFTHGCNLSIDLDTDDTPGAEYGPIDDQMKILKKWKYLHESIDWVYSLILKMPEKEPGFGPFLLSLFNGSCKRITNEAISPKYISTDNKGIANIFPKNIYFEDESAKRTLIEFLDFIDSKLYEEVFKGFEFFIHVLMLAEYPPDLSIEVINIIKKSDKGQPIIKEYLKRELGGCETSKKFEKLL